MMDLRNNHYARLGIPIDASSDEIRRAYREAARRLHPDTNPAPGATELFLKIQASYELLSDAAKRADYDKSLPPGFTLPPLIAIKTQSSHTALPHIDEPQMLYVLLELMPQSSPETRICPPLNICLVLDVSTSMQGAYLDTVKSTAIDLVRQLKPDDSFSIVTFSDKAEVQVPAGSHQDHGGIEFCIYMLHTSGGTEIYKGLEAGFGEIQRLISRESVNHLILITDGRTYGDEAECIRVAEEAAELGIGISTLGIGNKWNDAFLDRLASITGGSSMYITNPADISQSLMQKFNGLAASYADQVRFRFNPALGSELSYAFRLEPDVSVLSIEPPIQLGAVPLSGRLSVLLEFRIPPLPASIQHITFAEGHLLFDIPSQIMPTYTMRVKLDLPVTNAASAEVPPTTIVQAMSKLTLYRLQEKAHLDLEAGNIDAATRRLQNLATCLLSQGERELAKTVINEALHIQRTKRFSEQGNKRIKYGTRALLLPSSQHTSLAFIGANEKRLERKEVPL